LRWSGVRGSWHVLQRALGSILALCQQGARQRGASVARDREAWASCGTNATARGVGVPSWGVLSGRRSSRAGGGAVPVGLGQLRAASDHHLRLAFHSHCVHARQPLARPTQVAPGTPVSGLTVFRHAPPGPPCVGAACAAHGKGLAWGVRIDATSAVRRSGEIFLARCVRARAAASPCCQKAAHGSR
jgi:hypothetical protein